MTQDHTRAHHWLDPWLVGSWAEWLLSCWSDNPTFKLVNNTVFFINLTGFSLFKIWPYMSNNQKF